MTIEIVNKAFYTNKGFPMKNKLKEKIKENNQQKTSTKPTNNQQQLP